MTVEIIGEPEIQISTRRHDSDASRMGDVPEMEIAFIDNGQVPCGLGEPATTVIAPAIGNAFFAATGARLRHLPMRPADVRAALAAP